MIILFVDKARQKGRTIERNELFAKIRRYQGLGYLIASKKIKLFRFILFMFLFCMGTYYSIQMYFKWVDHPVLTTIARTAQSVKSVEFPSITICSPGSSESVTNAAIIKQFKDYLTNDLHLNSSLVQLYLATLNPKVYKWKNYKKTILNGRFKQGNNKIDLWKQLTIFRF